MNHDCPTWSRFSGPLQPGFGRFASGVHAFKKTGFPNGLEIRYEMRSNFDRMIAKLRRFMRLGVRKVFFPLRSTDQIDAPDNILKHVGTTHHATPLRANAELELETRAWLRDFWSRSFIAWLALVLSIASIVIALHSSKVAAKGHHEAKHQAGKR